MLVDDNRGVVVGVAAPGVNPDAEPGRCTPHPTSSCWSVSAITPGLGRGADGSAVGRPLGWHPPRRGRPARAPLAGTGAAAPTGTPAPRGHPAQRRLHGAERPAHPVTRPGSTIGHQRLRQARTRGHPHSCEEPMPCGPIRSTLDIKSSRGFRLAVVDPHPVQAIRKLAGTPGRCAGGGEIALTAEP